MGISKIDHLGIAVRNLEEASARYEKLLGARSMGREEVPSEGVRVGFFSLGESRFELLEALSEKSPVAKFLEKRGEGLHHVCLSVDDVAHEVVRLRALGFEFVGEAPRAGAGGHMVAFIHPRSAGGLLVELSQAASRSGDPH